MADLAARTETYCPDEVFDIELLDIDGSLLLNDDDGTVMTIGVIGDDSDEARMARNAKSNRRLAQGPRLKMTAEALDSEGAGYLAKLTKRWNITMGGSKPEFSYEAALQLYSNPKLSFIREQVNAAIGERSNFLKR